MGLVYKTKQNTGATYLKQKDEDVKWSVGQKHAMLFIPLSVMVGTCYVLGKPCLPQGHKDV